MRNPDPVCSACLVKDLARANQDFERAEKSADLTEVVLAYSELAIELASSANAKNRDGKQAIDFALKAAKLGAAINDPEILASAQIALAAARAESGDFAEAVRWQEQAMRIPQIRDLPEMRRRLERYRDKKPYRQE